MSIHRAAFLSLVLFGVTGLSAWSPEPPPTQSPSHSLMPVPASLQFQSGRLDIDASFTAAVTGSNDDRLRRGIARAVARLQRQTGVTFAHPLARNAAVAALVVECRGRGSAVPVLGEDESYSLDVSARQAVLRSPAVVGALRGLETFLQLVDGSRGAYFVPAVQIRDRPRFPWRGLLIDVSRHWQPVEVIERNLDGMAAVKLNVLHWHLTDDQGFRVESRRFPELQRLGSDGHYYTQAQLRAVVAYARDRGIRVVPEFDLPAHTTSWFVSHPELASAPGPYSIARRLGRMDAVMDPTREEVYQFLDGFIGEMAELFPGAYMHVGGDENSGRHWRANPAIQAFMTAHGIADSRALQAYFNQRLAAILKKHGKKMAGWDEILHPSLAEDVIVQSWRGPRSLEDAVKKGNRAILSSGYYLDLVLPAARHYAVDPLPAGSGLDAAQEARVLGGEACMWGEYVSPETLDSRIWPRLAAIAERLWSPPNVVDTEDMYRRLEVESARLTGLGLTHKTFVDPMLRRLAGTPEIGPLRTLADVVEPVKFYNRGRAYPTTSETPLTRLIDAARPDSAAARRFTAQVDGLLADAPRFHAHREELRQTLAGWRDARPALEAIIARAPELREAAPLAGELGALGEAGLEALEALSTGAAPAAGWRDAKLALLEQARRPTAEVEFAILPALRKLVDAAGVGRDNSSARE